LASLPEPRSKQCNTNQASAGVDYRDKGRHIDIVRDTQRRIANSEAIMMRTRRTCIGDRRARRWRAWAWCGGCSARRATGGCRWRCCSGCRPATAPSPTPRRPTARTPPPPWTTPTPPLAPPPMPPAARAINPPSPWVFTAGGRQMGGEGRSASPHPHRIWPGSARVNRSRIGFGWYFPRVPISIFGPRAAGGRRRAGGAAAVRGWEGRAGGGLGCGSERARSAPFYGAVWDLGGGQRGGGVGVVTGTRGFWLWWPCGPWCPRAQGGNAAFSRGSGAAALPTNQNRWIVFRATWLGSVMTPTGGSGSRARQRREY
jgi:hypothetical protein